VGDYGTFGFGVHQIHLASAAYAAHDMHVVTRRSALLCSALLCSLHLALALPHR
jgi:hypothetical protein